MDLELCRRRPQYEIQMKWSKFEFYSNRIGSVAPVSQLSNLLFYSVNGCCECDENGNKKKKRSKIAREALDVLNFNHFIFKNISTAF